MKQSHGIGRAWSLFVLSVACWGCAQEHSGSARSAAPSFSHDAAAMMVDAGTEPAALGNPPDATLCDAAAELDASTEADSALPDAAVEPASDAQSPEPDPPDASPESSCQPDAGGPYAVLEGETVRITVSCAQSGALQIDSLPEGATFAADTGRLVWTPNLAQAGRHELVVRDGPAGAPAVIRIDVVDRHDAHDNQPVDAAHYHEEYGLPVIHLQADKLNNDEYTPATIIYRGHSYVEAQAKLRGATSLSYPKNSFTLKFAKADKFNEPGFAGGFLKKRKVTVTTTFDDNSYLRQRFGYELWNRLDPAHIQVQAYNAVLFLNGRYHGLYTVTDHVDGYLMEDFGHNQDGDLYKARSAHANFRATLNGSTTPKESLHYGYTKEEGFPEPEEPGAFDNLDEFVRWVIETDPEQLALQAPSRIAVQEYIDWWIFVSFIAADDTISKNTYHYRDPTLAGSVWHVVPWDLNHSFGQDWNTERVIATVTRPEGLYPRQNNLFEKLLAGPLAPSMRERYAQVLARQAYAIDDVLALYDQLATEIEPSAQRDARKWGDRYRSFGHWNDRADFTSYEEEVQYIRDWLRERHAYLQTIYPSP